MNRKKTLKRVNLVAIKMLDIYNIFKRNNISVFLFTFSLFFALGCQSQSDSSFVTECINRYSQLKEYDFKFSVISYDSLRKNGPTTQTLYDSVRIIRKDKKYMSDYKNRRLIYNDSNKIEINKELKYILFQKTNNNSDNRWDPKFEIRSTVEELSKMVTNFSFKRINESILATTICKENKNKIEKVSFLIDSNAVIKEIVFFYLQGDVESLKYYLRQVKYIFHQSKFTLSNKEMKNFDPETYIKNKSPLSAKVPYQEYRVVTNIFDIYKKN
jgi:hypothetical protein